MVRSRDESASESVHLCERTYLSGVCEVVCELASREARARCGLDCNDPDVSLALDLVSHERSNESAEVRSAACAADDDVGLDAVLL